MSTPTQVSVDRGSGRRGGASGGDVQALVYLAGQFNEDHLSFGGTVDKDDCREPLQENSVYIRDPQTSDAAS